MGRQGPCCHCQIKSGSVWRAGPSDKPVLCNACGIRWKKGTLEDYVPRHTQYQERLPPSSTTTRSSNSVLIALRELQRNTRRKKRSVRKPQPRTGRFCEGKLVTSLQHEPEFSSELQRSQEGGILVAQLRNPLAYEDEVGAGCMLLKPQP